MHNGTHWHSFSLKSSDDYSSSKIKSFMGSDAEKELTTDKVFSTALEGLLSTVFPSALLRAQHSMRSLLRMLQASMLQSSCGSTQSRSSTCHFLKCKATVKRWAQCDILSWSLWKKLLARGRNFCLIVRIRIAQCSEYIVSLMARIRPELQAALRHLDTFFLLFKLNHTFFRNTIYRADMHLILKYGAWRTIWITIQAS